MVKALFTLAKYLTWWFITPLASAVVKFQSNACSSCFKQYFPSLLGGENIHNYFIKSIASSHYFIKSITSSRCVEDTPGYTLVHTLVHVKYSPARWVSPKFRRKSKTFPCLPRIALIRLVHSIQCPNLNVSGSATRLPICIAKLSSNKHLRLGSNVNSRFSCDVIIFQNSILPFLLRF